ncbi:MAG: MATE family efflux transporter [Lachnospiraceae bacterium]|nr:MATE family efflux transporter [Lachnospiraceae bacterium]
MRLILSFSVPLVLGFWMQQLYLIVDMIVVGRFISVGALAGVGMTGAINFLIIGLCIGLCSGFAIPVAQKFGAGDYVMMRRFIANSVWLSIAFAIVITIITATFAGNILTIMKAPADIYDYAYSYIFIIFLGIPTVFLYNLLAGVMRAIGDSKTPMKILIVSSVLHIILDIVFVVGLNSGTAGVAYSTVISQFTSGILCLIILMKKFPILQIKKDEWRWQSSLAFTLCGMGIPMGLQYSITAIGSVILQSAVNTLGSAAVASIAAAVKVSIFFSCAFDALGNAMSTFGGQNVGAGRLDRLNSGIKASVIIAVVYSFTAYIIIWIFGKDLIMLFIDKSETHILNDSLLFLRIMTAFYIPLALVVIYRFLIQGMGFGTLAIVAGICEMIARAFAAFFLVPYFGFTAAAFASPLAWIFADIFLVPAYHYCKKKLAAQMVIRV